MPISAQKEYHSAWASMGRSQSERAMDTPCMAFGKRSVSAPPSIWNARHVISFARLGPIPAKAAPPIPVPNLTSVQPKRLAMPVKTSLSNEVVKLSSGADLILAIDFTNTFQQVEDAIRFQLGYPVKISFPVPVHIHDRFWTSCATQQANEVHIVKLPKDGKYTI